MLAMSLCRYGIWVFRNGKTWGRSGKFVASCRATLNSSDVNPPLCNTLILKSSTHWIQSSSPIITANDKINALTLSPLSGLVSWLNCTSAPRNFFTLVTALFESCKIDGVEFCCVVAVEVGGGVVDPGVIFTDQNENVPTFRTQKITIYYWRWAAVPVRSRRSEWVMMLWRYWRLWIHHLYTFGWIRRSASVFT